MKSINHKQLLASALRAADIPFSESQLSELAKRQRRVHIVSTQLCDDVIHRLGSSLDPYQGCDLIDLNPGLGLWSTKLHERLKPRRHLLVEQDGDVFKPFLAPLLRRKGSKVTLVTNVDPFEPRDLEKLLDHLPEQARLDPSSEAANRMNNSVLLVGSLANHRSADAKLRNSPAMHVIHYLLKCVEGHRGLNRIGLMRMLFWVHSQRDRDTMLESNVTRRLKLAFNLEKWLDSLQEIAGTEPSQKPNRVRGRSEILDRQSQQATEERAKLGGIQIPAHRPLRLTKAPEIDINDWNGQPIPILRHVRDYGLPLLSADKAWVKLLGDYMSGKFTKVDGGPTFAEQDENQRRNMAEFDSSPDPDAVQDVRSKGNTAVYNRLAVHRNSIVARAVRIQRTMKLVKKGSILEAEQAPPQAALDKLWREWEALDENSRMQSAKFADEASAVNRTKPLMLWDRREAEPLLVGEKEVLPAGIEAHLLDFRQRAQESALADSSEWTDGYEPYDVLLELLIQKPSDPIHQALDDIYPGAAEALIPQVPAITDPRQGGKHDFRQMRVRMLTIEMLTELDRAWRNWLFRPTRAEVMLRITGGHSHHGDADNRELMLDRRSRMAGV